MNKKLLTSVLILICNMLAAGDVDISEQDIVNWKALMGATWDQPIETEILIEIAGPREAFIEEDDDIDYQDNDELMNQQATASSISQSNEPVYYSVNREPMQKFMRTLWDNIYHSARYLSSSPLSPALIEDEIDHDAIKQIDNNEIREFLKKDFDLIWDYDLFLNYNENEELQKNPPITPLNEVTLAAFKKQAEKLVIGMFIEHVVRDIMHSCECIPTADRISYSFILADDIRKKFPDPKQPIVITAFASGLLLQEYLLLTLLKQYGYNNIVLNLVDLGYPDPILLQRIIKQIESSNATRAIKHFKHEVIRAAGLHDADSDEKRTWINENKKLFPELAKLIEADDDYESGYGYQKALEH